MLHRAIRSLAVVWAAGFLASCASRTPALTSAELDHLGERYARMVLAMGKHDPDYVDAYYGPPEWKLEADRDSIPLARIVATTDSLVLRLNAPAPRGAGELIVMRQRFLRRQLEALAFRARMLNGEQFSFDQESQALYDAVAPSAGDSAFRPALSTLDSLLPGTGPIVDRWERYREAFKIPAAKLDTVFDVAIREARRRTREHIALPDSESFVVEFVTGQPWGGYNWYQGGYRSLIQVNIDLPSYIDRALDLACHEGYPGHHVYGVLLEQALVRERGWTEFTIYPLMAPQSLIAEGTAVMGTDVAFPGAERDRFTKGVLCPLAGIDTSAYDRFARISDAMQSLSMTGVEGARRWLDGKMTREEAKHWLEEYAIRTPERADKDLRFAERYRSYVVNYRLGRTMVLDWLERNGGDAAHPARRWELYQTLLASPRLPQDLRAQ